MLVWLSVCLHSSLCLPALFSVCPMLQALLCRETNLKVRQALPETAILGGSADKLSAFDGNKAFYGLVIV